MIQIVGLNFRDRTERKIEAGELAAARGPDEYVWVDMDLADPEAARRALRDLRVGDHAAAEAVGPAQDGRYDLHEECLHFEVTEVRPASDGGLVDRHVDVLLGAGFMVTIRRDTVDFLRMMRRNYREDFFKFSKSPGFLVYEIADGLLDGYRRTMRTVSESVEKVLLELFSGASDEIFQRVQALTRDLLQFRLRVMAARELLHELGTRRSPFVSETTQPYLENIAMSLERLGADLAAERDSLTNSLQLYMGMVSHRTSRVLSRLTVVSVIFLPLTFLCGVYGMNLRIPETEWAYGYLAFWIAVAAITVGLLALMRRNKWLG